MTEPVGPLLSASMLTSTVIVFLGSMYTYWAHVQPMRALMLAREYNDVYPEQPAVAFGDAAFIKFAGNTTVDVAQAVRIRSLDAGLNTFCAAPVHSRTGRVEFWAVGIDCCGDSNHGTFQCGDIGKTGTRNAYVRQNPTDMLFDSIGKYIAPPMVRRDIFLQAIRKAEYSKNIVGAREPLLVSWTSQTKDEVVALETFRTVVQVVLNVLFSAIMSLGLAKLNERFAFLRKKHREEVYGTDADVSAIISEFMNSARNDLNVKQSPHSMLMRTMHRQALSKVDMCLMGVLLPYIIMMLCVILTTYTGCARNGHHVSSTFYVVLSLIVLALVATPHRTINGCWVFLVAIVGLYIGYENYNYNMFHYCAVEHGRTYAKVRPDADTGIYEDGGILKFGKTAYLSQDHAVGFLHKDIVYCAAPVLSTVDDITCANQSSAPTPAAAPAPATASSFIRRSSRKPAFLDTDLDLDLDSEDGISSDANSDDDLEAAPPAKCTKAKRVEFWAIGTNCCGSRRDFRCDGGKDLTAHSGVIVRGTGEDDELGVSDTRQLFFKAVTQSVAAYNFPELDNPVLIRWGKDPKMMQNEWASSATGIVILTGVLGFIVIAVSGAVSYMFMVRIRNQEKKDGSVVEDEDPRAKASQAGPARTGGQLVV